MPPPLTNRTKADALLEVRRATKVFGGDMLERARTVALRDVSLALGTDPPLVTAVVGESGSGKTTLARLLLGLTEPTHGDVLYRGTPLTRLRAARRREFMREVQVVFQDPYEVYNPFYKVDRVLWTPVTKFRLARTRADGQRLIEEALTAVGLRPEDTLGRHPHQLSGGQRQRIMVARALLPRPRLIVADEPVSMVDSSLRATILHTLRGLNRDFGISLLYITHDLTTAYQISDRILVLYRGAPVEIGDVERVVHEPQHPYTKLLIGSVPLPNPDRPWRRDAVTARPTRPGVGRGCAFAPRCPSAMPRCDERPPPLFRTERARATACYLYDASPAIAPEGIGSALSGGSSIDGETAAKRDGG